MRIKGITRIDKTVCIGISDNNIVINDRRIIISKSVKVSTELLHALTVDYAFHRLHEIDNRYSIYAIHQRRKATRRIMHDADTTHKIIDANYTCPLLLRGKPYAWNREIYDFKTEKFIEKNLK